MAPRTRKFRRLVSAIIASAVAWLMGEAHVFKAPPGFDAETLKLRFEQAAGAQKAPQRQTQKIYSSED